MIINPQSRDSYFYYPYAHKNHWRKLRMCMSVHWIRGSHLLSFHSHYVSHTRRICVASLVFPHEIIAQQNFYTRFLRIALNHYKMSEWKFKVSSIQQWFLLELNVTLKECVLFTEELPNST